MRASSSLMPPTGPSHTHATFEMARCWPNPLFGQSPEPRPQPGQSQPHHNTMTKSARNQHRVGIWTTLADRARPAIPGPDHRCHLVRTTAYTTASPCRPQGLPTRGPRKTHPTPSVQRPMPNAQCPWSETGPIRPTEIVSWPHRLRPAAYQDLRTARLAHAPLAQPA